MDSETISQLLYNMPSNGDEASVLSACLSVMFGNDISVEITENICRLRLGESADKDDAIVDTVMDIWTIDDDEVKRKRFIVCEAYAIVAFRTQNAYSG